jgi:transcription antitermination factor NusG
MQAAASDNRDGLKGRTIPREEWPERYLKPLFPSLTSMVRDPDAMCLASGNWYTVCAEPRHETLAKSELAECGLLPYLPMEPRLERHGRGRFRSVARPMIPGYLFVKCLPTAEHLHKVTAARGVRKLVTFNGSAPAVPEGAIEVVRLVEAMMMENEAARIERELENIRRKEAVEAAKLRVARGERSGIVWYFSPGDRARIKTGPFAGFCAELESTVDPHDRIRAVVSLFGRASTIDISAFDIEAL